MDWGTIHNPPTKSQSALWRNSGDVVVASLEVFQSKRHKNTVLGFHVYMGGLLNLEGKYGWEKDLSVGPCLN